VAAAAAAAGGVSLCCPGVCLRGVAGLHAVTTAAHASSPHHAPAGSCNDAHSANRRHAGTWGAPGSGGGKGAPACSRRPPLRWRPFTVLRATGGFRGLAGSLNQPRFSKPVEAQESRWRLLGSVLGLGAHSACFFLRESVEGSGASACAYGPSHHGPVLLRSCRLWLSGIYSG
jgi:hypothetical protein